MAQKGALIGLGRMGRIHLRHLTDNKRVTLKYVLDLDEDFVKSVLRSERINSCIPAALNQLEDVLDDSEICWVLISTPGPTHFELIKKIFAKGKAVFCEKPLSPSIEEIKESYQLAEKLTLPLMVGFQRRFGKGPEKLRFGMETGTIGRVTTIRMVARDFPGAPVSYVKESKARGSYCYLTDDFALHDLDTLLWLMDESLPVYVQTVGSYSNPELKALGDPDVIIATLKFANDVIATIDCGFSCTYGYDIRIEVIGEDGVLKLENTVESELVTIAGQRMISDSFPDSFPERYKKNYAAEFNHFIDAVEGKDELAVTREHVLKVHQVSAMMKESLLTGKPVTN